MTSSTSNNQPPKVIVNHGNGLLTFISHNSSVTDPIHSAQQVIQQLQVVSTGNPPPLVHTVQPLLTPLQQFANSNPNAVQNQGSRVPVGIRKKT